MKQLLILCLLLFSRLGVFSQQVRNIVAEADGERIKIKYQLQTTVCRFKVARQ